MPAKVAAPKKSTPSAGTPSDVKDLGLAPKGKEREGVTHILFGYDH